MFTGVDDGFLIIHRFNQMTVETSSGESAATMSRADKLSMALRDVGPSVAITSLTNSLAFLSGSLL